MNWGKKLWFYYSAIPNYFTLFNRDDFTWWIFWWWTWFAEGSVQFHGLLNFLWSLLNVSIFFKISQCFLSLPFPTQHTEEKAALVRYICQNKNVTDNWKLIKKILSSEKMQNFPTMKPIHFAHCHCFKLLLKFTQISFCLSTLFLWHTLDGCPAGYDNIIQLNFAVFLFA